jgi:hypothetical protein
VRAAPLVAPDPRQGARLQVHLRRQVGQPVAQLGRRVAERLPPVQQPVQL